jgi:glutaminase
VFGEAALIDGGRRSATVVADGPVVLRSLSVDALDRLAMTHPHVHASLLAGLGPYHSEMLRRALGEISALDG